MATTHQVIFCFRVTLFFLFYVNTFKGPGWWPQPVSSISDFYFEWLPWYMTCLGHVPLRCLFRPKSLKLGLIRDLEGMWAIFRHLAGLKNVSVLRWDLNPGPRDHHIRVQTSWPPPMYLQWTVCSIQWQTYETSTVHQLGTHQLAMGSCHCEDRVCHIIQPGSCSKSHFMDMVTFASVLRKEK